MDLKNLGSVILEALAVQGKITNIENRVSTLNTQVSNRRAEDTKRSTQVRKDNDADLDAAGKLNKEVSALKQELEKRLSDLKKNGVDISAGISGAASISM